MHKFLMAAAAALLAATGPAAAQDYPNRPINVVVPYAAGTLNVDSKSRVWENRLTYDAGVKVVRHFVGGVVEGGVAGRRQHELLTGRVESAPVVYVNLWIGWNPRSTSQQ